MRTLRPEIQELIRASETVLSLESIGDVHLSVEERGIILLCAEDLSKKFVNRGNVKVDGHADETACRTDRPWQTCSNAEHSLPSLL